ncbi:MAG: type I 3-dehydroquinate dehydratase [Phycisphaeraceae bacterium]|nr:type I 3-dehydroquinate dehydratase [Phycisphaeraceae bacterium]
MTLLCVSILVQDEAQAVADALAAKDAGAELVEFRIDEFFTGAVNESSGELDALQVKAILRMVAGSPLPCIVTCRAMAESGGAGGVGGYDGDEAGRVSLYERLGTARSVSEGRGHRPHEGVGVGELKEHPPRYLDFEYASYVKSANIKQKINLGVRHPGQVRGDVETGLILSMHDFGGRPADLTRRILAMQAEPAASVVKFAFRARSLRDNLEVFDLLREQREMGGGGGKPMVGLAMGEYGLMSRVLAPKFGGFLTYAGLRKASTTAPGQPSVRELLDMYRFRSIGPKTKVYGVIGSPTAVGHSLSPLVHNAGFKAVGHDGVYLPLPIGVDEEDPAGEKTYLSLRATLDALIEHEGLDLAGLSVTMPFKEMVWRWASQRDWSTSRSAGSTASAEFEAACGAVNTLAALDQGGRPLLRNTDALAFVRLLHSEIGPPEGKSALVLGAGGVARAAVVACQFSGMSVTIVNRTADRAERLADEVDPANERVSTMLIEEMADLNHLPFDAVINCTSVGMKGGTDPKGLPLPAEALDKLPEGAVVFETVYAPVRTPLVRAAEERGLRVIDGVQMFVEQAAEQFRLWTGKDAPKGLFDRLCRETLAEREGA